MTNPDDENSSAKMVKVSGTDTEDLDQKRITNDLSLEELKSFILSIEWEISDDIMTQFIDEVEMLKTGYKGDNVIAIFLKLLAIIGKYIRAKKVASHPDSIKLLNSVFNNLETIVSSTTLNDDQKKKLLLKEAGKFKDLKEKIALSKTIAFASTSQQDHPRRVQADRPAEKDRSAEKNTKPFLPAELSSSGTQEDALSPANEYLLREIKRMVKMEFETMKAEIQELLDRGRQ